MLSFGVVYPNKTRFYFVETEKEYKGWFNAIKKVTSHESIKESYEIQTKLGTGKFGQVRLGVHIETGRKVAIKIIEKKDMSQQDLNLVKAEFEIMKVCSHPNIIQIYDFLENDRHIYIIMEHCSGGDLFGYIEKRGFRLPEERAAELIAQIASSLNYIHTYGVVHRDLKPENILMTDESDEAQIKLLDFGLSKIIGPNEKCIEPFGTLSYVAPEVLTEKPYGKEVDIWSLGILTYLLCVGCLPFDHETSEREIAKQTIKDPVPFHYSIWKKLSAECMKFVASEYLNRFTRERPKKKDENRRSAKI